MKKRLCVLFLLLWGVVSYAQSRNNGTITISDFRQIDSRGNIQLLLYQSDTLSSIAVELHGIETKNFTYRVRKGVLYLNVPSGLFDSQGFARVVVSSPNLQKVSAEGASIDCVNAITGDFFDFESKGSINSARIDVDVKKLVVRVAGKSDIAVCGRAKSGDFKALFGSRIDAFSLNIDTVSVECSGVSEVYVNPNDLLRARVNTAATVYYATDATIAPRVSTNGDIVKVERVDYRPMFEDILASEQSQQATDSIRLEVGSVESTIEQPTKETQQKAPQQVTTSVERSKRSADKKARQAKPDKNEKHRPAESSSPTNEDFF